MNFLILSPQFPATNWNFCDRLKLNGINTLGIGYEPYEELRIEVRHALQDYIQKMCIRDRIQTERKLVTVSL